MLKPGGRFAVSDGVADEAVPADFWCNMEAWICGLAGALEIDTYQQMLAEAGFEAIGVEITRRYTAAEAGLDSSNLSAGWEAGDGKLASAFVRATKPVTATPTHPNLSQGTVEVSNSISCCGGGCCSARLVFALATLSILLRGGSPTMSEGIV